MRLVGAILGVIVILCNSACAQPKTQAISPKSVDLSVKSGSIVLKVPDYDSTRSRILKIADQYQATLRDENSEVNLAGERHGELTLDVNADDISSLMNAIRHTGKLYSERALTSDQTSGYERMEKRIALLRQNESELAGIMNRPKRMRGSDILFLQYRLFQTRVEAADAAQERTDLERRSRRAMLNIILFEPEQSKNFSFGDWRAHGSYRAKSSFAAFSQKFVTGSYLVVWFAPIWIPLAIVAFFIGRKTIRWGRLRLADLKNWLGNRKSSTPSE